MGSFGRLSIALFSVVVFSFESGEARRHQQNRSESPDSVVSDGNNSTPNTAGQNTDSDLVRAVRDHRRIDFVEGGGMVVTRILKDDQSGSEHQKWVVRLSDGSYLQAVYNLDMCPRVEIKVGDVISMGGQFIWTNQGGMLHWLHKDPRGNRKDGYVFANGKFYCK